MAKNGFWDEIKKNWMLVGGVVVLLLIFGVYTGAIPLTIVTYNVPAGQTWTPSPALALSGIPAPVNNTSGQNPFVSVEICAGYIIDSSGNFKYQDTPVSLPVGTTTYTSTNLHLAAVNATAGTYAAGIVCLTQNTTYSYTTQTWSSWSNASVSAQMNVSLQVGSAGGPSTPTINPTTWTSLLGTYWNSMMSTISCWITQILGGTC